MAWHGLSVLLITGRMSGIRRTTLSHQSVLRLRYLDFGGVTGVMGLQTLEHIQSD